MQVSYRAPATCPAEADFLDRVRSRTQRGSFAERGQFGHAFDVRVQPFEPGVGFLGQLEFQDADGQRVVRSLVGTTCDELVSSLALITALAIDDRTPEPTSTDTSSAAATAPVPADPSPPPTPTKPARTPSAPERTRPRLTQALPRSSARPTLRGELGLHVGALSWLTQSAAASFGGYVEVGSRGASWSVRLSGFDARRSRGVALGTADFSADWLRLEACPVVLAERSHFSLAPCAAFDGGVLRASAEPSAVLTPAPKKRSAWLSSVALLRLSYRYGRWLVLGLEGALAVPWVRYSYQFRNSDGTVTPILAAPQWGLGATGGVGVRFP